MQIKSHIWAFILTLVVVSSAHANQPSSEDVEKLTRDVDHLVHITEQANWHIDAEELAGLQTDILLVICPASPALAQETVYVEQHRPTEQMLLGFDGGGMFNVMPFGDQLRFGFGGSSRLSFGYGVSERFVLRMGFEFGGAGLLDKDVEVTEVETQFYAGVPIALRYLWDIWFIEGDLGPIAMGLPWKQEPDYGGRFSTMFGFSSAKISKVQPWAGLRFSTDYLPANGLSDGFIFRSGFRFGIDYRGL